MKQLLEPHVLPVGPTWLPAAQLAQSEQPSWSFRMSEDEDLEDDDLFDDDDDDDFEDDEDDEFFEDDEDDLFDDEDEELLDDDEEEDEEL